MKRQKELWPNSSWWLNLSAQQRMYARKEYEETSRRFLSIFVVCVMLVLCLLFLAACGTTQPGATVAPRPQYPQPKPLKPLPAKSLPPQTASTFTQQG